MAVDKNLFLYDLAVVAIMKNEGPYVKEWLDYHILAGVEHFYIYDNDSPDNLREVLKPYVDAGVVTYIFAPKKHQDETYNEAKRDFRFFCRYMAFIDGDEFIFPKARPTITEFADDIFSSNPNVGGLSIHWRFFGSNYQDNADYSRGVLERFTRCDDKVNVHFKHVLNPRKIKFFLNPHYAIYFNGCYSMNENKALHLGTGGYPPTDEKIVIHHYHTKSREEWVKKVARGNPDNSKRNINEFSHEKRNTIFNDDILKYRDSRQQQGGGYSTTN